METTNVYDTLYNNMKQRFTVVSGENEYTLGGYMKMKANESKENRNLPATVASHRPAALGTFLNYMNKKLTVKQQPAPEKTIKAFPFRTSIAAFLSAAVTCSLIFSFSFLAVKGFSAANGDNIVEADVQDTPETAEEIYETVS